MEAMLRYRGRVVSAADIEQIRRLIAQHPTASRRALSHKLCAAWNWVQPNGALRDMVCRGLMLELHRAGLIELPPQRRRPHNPLAERQRPEPVSIDTTPLRARLAEIQPLAFRLVRRTAEEPLFNGLIERYHYLGYTQPVGEHLKYLIYGRGRPLACHLGPRDRFIGWSAAARRHNIHLVAYNPRFLVLPWIEVPHLASHLLGRMARRLSADWERLYRHPIYFVETFVDPARFRGTCYRAANWIVLGRTTGRGKDAPTKQPNRPLKEVWGYPLAKRFRERLAEVSL
jgi:hypothetical protein